MGTNWEKSLLLLTGSDFQKGYMSCMPPFCFGLVFFSTHMRFLTKFFKEIGCWCSIYRHFIQKCSCFSNDVMNEIETFLPVKQIL